MKYRNAGKEEAGDSSPTEKQRVMEK